MAKSGKEIIAELIGFDLSEMNEYEYQPTRYSEPKVYSVSYRQNNFVYEYLCCPPKGKGLPKRYWDGMTWEKARHIDGRDIYGGYA